jgi:hypothetical protein
MKKLIFLSSLALSLFSCSKDDSSAENSQPQVQNIYAGGNERNSNQIQTSKTWKNGVETILGDGIKRSKINAVFVSGGDYYAVGYQENAAGIDVATLWKNGVKTNLTCDCCNI